MELRGMSNTSTGFCAQKTIRKQKFAIVGLVAALVFAVVGVDVVQGASATPSSFYTCTKNGVKFKIVSTPTCKAGKHPQTLNKWDNDATVGSAEGALNSALTTATKYETIDHGGTLPADGDFTGLSFANTYVPVIGGHPGVSSTWTNFSGDNFTSAKLSELQASNFTGANFTLATFYPTLSGDPAPQGIFGIAAPGGNNFTDANFTDANFTSVYRTSFIDDDFNGANFTGANFTAATMGGFEATGSTFVGAIWSNTTCPDGSNSNTNLGHTCEGYGLP